MNAAVTWDASGVTVQVPASETRVEHTRRLSHEELAALTDYDALALGLPRLMEATLALRIEGRIDGAEFCITHTIEPFTHLHPWAAYQRMGALLFVGARILRLNPQQLHVLDALDAMAAAGSDVAARLHAWSRLHDALHMTGRHQVLVENDFPHLRLHMVEQLPLRSKTRVDGILHSVIDQPGAAWAMESGRRYYVRKPAEIA